MKVENYECLATLKSNIQRAFIDEEWVVNQYLLHEQKKSWKDIETTSDMSVLTLEREMLAESLAVHPDTLPPITDCDPVENDVIDIDIDSN